MQILNIGPLELLIFLIVAFILLGPKDMVLTAYKIGQAIRKFVRSPVWREILRSAQEIRELPTKLMDETGLQQELDAIKKDTEDTAKELNASMNEATNALRVPEAENIKLETGPKIEPAAGAVPASADHKSNESMPSMPAVFSGPPIPGLAQIPSTETTKDVPDEDTNPTGAAAQESIAPESQADAGVLPEPSTSETIAQSEVEPVVAKTKRTSRKKTVKGVETGQTESSEPAAADISPEPEVKKPKQTNRKKVVKPGHDEISLTPASPVTVELAVAEQPEEAKTREVVKSTPGGEQDRMQHESQPPALEPEVKQEVAEPVVEQPKKVTRKKTVKVAVADEHAVSPDSTVPVSLHDESAEMVKADPEAQSPKAPARKNSGRQKKEKGAVVDTHENQPADQANMSQEQVDEEETTASQEKGGKKSSTAGKKVKKVSSPDNGHSTELKFAPGSEINEVEGEPEKPQVSKRTRSNKRAAPTE